MRINQSGVCYGTSAFVLLLFIKLASAALIDHADANVIKEIDEATPPSFCKFLNFVNRSKAYGQNEAISFVTHASASHLHHVTEIAQRWNGPVEVALILHNRMEMALISKSLQLLRFCNQDIAEKVSFHLAYRQMQTENNCNVPSSAENNLSFLQTGACNGLQQFLKSEYAKADNETFYEINFARNFARSAVRTSLMLIADIELMPVAKFSQRFLDFYQRHQRALLKNRTEADDSKLVFVIPVFELQDGEAMPTTKRELAVALRQKLAVPFHKRRAYECHAIPRLLSWLRSDSAVATTVQANDSTQDDDGSELGIFTRTKWRRPCWEPVFVSDNRIPWHDERFRGYGKNKIQQVYEMCRSNFTFLVMQDLFLVHYRISVLTRERWETIAPAIAINNQLYANFKEELDKKYPHEELKEYCNGN